MSQITLTSPFQALVNTKLFHRSHVRARPHPALRCAPPDAKQRATINGERADHGPGAALHRPALVPGTTSPAPTLIEDPGAGDDGLFAGTMDLVVRAPLADPTRGPMVGRSRELKELRERFAVASRGDPQVVVIGGEAGIGKSRLVAEFADSLNGNARLVVGHCLELGPDAPPLAPFAAIVRSLAAAIGPQHLAELAGPGISELAGLAPELGMGGADDSLGRGRLFEAMATLVERDAAEHPLVLVFEDLHWSDSSTRDLLRFLMRTVSDAKVLYVLTYRRDEVRRGHAVLPWLVEVDRLPHAHRISLDPLTDAQVDALVQPGRR